MSSAPFALDGNTTVYVYRTPAPTRDDDDCTRPAAPRFVYFDHPPPTPSSPGTAVDSNAKPTTLDMAKKSESKTREKEKESLFGDIAIKVGLMAYCAALIGLVCGPAAILGSGFPTSKENWIMLLQIVRVIITFGCGCADLDFAAAAIAVPGWLLLVWASWNNSQAWPSYEASFVFYYVTLVSEAASLAVAIGAYCLLMGLSKLDACLARAFGMMKARQLHTRVHENDDRADSDVSLAKPDPAPDVHCSA